MSSNLDRIVELLGIKLPPMYLLQIATALVIAYPFVVLVYLLVFDPFVGGYIKGRLYWLVVLMSILVLAVYLWIWLDVKPALEE